MSFDFDLFSAKQLDFLENSDRRVNIATGAVRSGKTVITNLRFCVFVLESKYTEFLITSKTQQSLYRNVLKPLRQMFDTFGVRTVHKKVDMILEVHQDGVVKEIYLVGLTDEGSTERLQGMTIHSWLADEIVNAPTSSVDMGYSRCSLPGAKMFFTCNPSTPYHPIFTEFIDDEEAISSGRVGVWRFTLEDNLTLDPSYKRDLIAKEKKKGGIFYRRNILGEWCISEGAIYQNFDERKHTFDGSVVWKDYDNLNVGVDYGVASQTVFILTGLKYNEAEDATEYSVLKEFVFDADESGVQTTDSALVGDMKEFLRGVPYNRINVPHDARSFNSALEDAGFRTEMINPDVNLGINTIRDLFANDRLLIHSNCGELVRCINSYVWDPKAKLRGVEKPLKRDDHACDALRYSIGIENVFKPIVSTAGYW